MELSKYDQLSARNIIKPIIHKLLDGTFEIEADHKIYLRNSIMPERPWLNSKSDPERYCNKWSEVYFNYYKIIPIACRNCWKICFVPETLTELFKVRDLQDAMGFVSKCGAELRAFSGNKGGYMAVWYSPLDGGLKRGREIHGLVDAKIQSLLGRDEKREVTLKRGCTAMEKYTMDAFNIGADKWDGLAEKLQYDAREILLDTVWMTVKKIIDVPTFANEHIEQLMIDFAFENGDKTYLEYTNGIPHVAPLVTFNDSKHKHQDFKSTWRNNGPDNDRPDNAEGKPLVEVFREATEDELDGADSPIIRSIS